MKHRNKYFPIFSFAFASVFSLLAADSFAVPATINASNDTTIYQGFVPGDTDNIADNNSCGAGDHLIAGATDKDKNQGAFPRRALLKFDIAAQIPPGSTINSVTLTMDVNRSGDNADRDMSLHPVTRDWGEGTLDCGDAQSGGAGPGQGSEAATGDATWLDAMFEQTSWTNAGGDIGAASATASIPTRGAATWISTTNPAMVADVQNWLDDSAGNFGWILKATNESVNNTSRRFGSREGGPAPVLTIDYTPSGAVEECCDVDGQFNGICSLVLEGTCQTPPANPNDPPTCDPNTCPQPVGACCNADESCSDLVTAAECAATGGMFNGDGSQCSDNQVSCGLEPFVDALPWPVPEVQPVTGEIGGVASYEITMTEISQQLHRDLPDTTVWGYQGSFPGPTLEATVGNPISVKVVNDLPTSGHYLTVDTCPHGPNYWRDSSLTSVHLHGGHVPARFDGQPEYTFFPGEFDTYEYPNNQLPATLWYHDHALGITRLNVYMGLAAYYMLRPDCAVTPNDPECNGSLPPKAYEVPVVIQDRTFTESGDLLYPPRIVGGGFFGDKVLVNGKVWPYLNVNKGKYRFRLLNGSQAREYTLRLENLADPGQVIPFTLIGTDGGLISAPKDMSTIHMVPAERFDVVIDFAGFTAGTEIVLRNDEASQPRLPNVMKFIVQGQAGHTAPLPATLTTVASISENESDGTRYFNFVNVSEQCAGGEWLIQTLDGPDPATATVLGEHWDDIDAFPVLGTTEVWEFINESNMMHPMHVHLVQFQILDRCPVGGGQCETLAPHEAGTWKDTVRVPPGTRVRVIMRFENYPGKFPAHCHLLDHEDHEMMRQFQTTWDPALATVDGVCGPQEDCISNPDDCGTVPGNLCGNKLCEIGDGEDFLTCPQDCNGKTKGKNRFNCGSDDVNDPGYNCGFAEDGFTVEFDGCITDDYFCRVKARVPACCGDRLCEGQETIGSCAVDCDPNACSPTEPGTELTCDDGEDNDCDGFVDLADPDCQVCVPDEDPEVSCFDGNDNDCDEQTDCADGDCDGAANGSCNTGQPGICAAGTTTCSGGGEVCQQDTPAAEESEAAGTCNDGLDNDCDGLMDANDPDCQVCVPDEDPEVSCFDGNDNDCNNDTDCADANCDGGADPGRPTTCGVGVCAATGNIACSGGGEVDNCSPLPATEQGVELTCNDGLDNDCDGDTDGNDSDCQTGLVCEDITNKSQCRDEPTCRWKSGSCQTR